MVHLLHRYMV